MNPELIGMGVELLGGAWSSNAQQQKANSVAERLKELRTRDQAESLALRDQDQAEAAALARADEARMAEAHRAGIGYDLARLRSEASAAGFNPLTVLQATGAANYAVTPVPTLTTPFVSRPFTSRVDAVKEAQLAKISSAGYMGDAVSRMGSSYIGISQATARLAADKELADAMRQPVRTGDFPRGATQIDARPTSGFGLPGFAGPALGGAPIRTTVLADDGLPTANPESPMDIMADIYATGRGGDATTIPSELWWRNKDDLYNASPIFWDEAFQAAQKTVFDATWAMNRNLNPANKVSDLSQFLFRETAGALAANRARTPSRPIDPGLGGASPIFRQ